MAELSVGIEMEPEVFQWVAQVSKENDWSIERTVKEIMVEAHKKFEAQ